MSSDFFCKILVLLVIDIENDIFFIFILKIKVWVENLWIKFVGINGFLNIFYINFGCFLV